MTATAKPILDPAGTPGNMQDVKDLQHMLANTLTLLETSEKRVATLTAEVAELQEKLDAKSTALTTVEGELEDAKGEIDGLNDEIDGLEGKIEDLEAEALQESEIRDLARARTMLRDGKHADGLYEVERVLDRVGGAWRTFA